MTAVLELRELAVRRGRRRVIDGHNLALEPGELAAVVGPNGCGKSTLLACVGGVLAPAAGAVLVDGASVWGAQRQTARRRLGYVPEAADPPGHLTGAELWALVAATKGVAAGGDELGTDLRSALRLDELAGTRLDHMSLGQRRRACLGAAFIGSPSLLVLDEPDNGLDDRAHDALVMLLRAHRERGGAALVATHDPAMIETIEARRVELRPAG